MNPASPEKPEPFSHPAQELSHVRELSRTFHEEALQGGAEVSREQATRRTLDRYRSTPPEHGPTARYALRERELEQVARSLAPEPHDRQMERLFGILETRGIKSALRVVEQAKNPHLFDDFHRFLVQLVASGYTVPDMRKRKRLWKSLNMTLFEVGLPEASEEEREQELQKLLAGMEQLYAGMLATFDRGGSTPRFSLEIANAHGSDEFVFYVAVPSDSTDLFEKHVASLFPNASVKTHPDDYNVFNPEGASVAAVARLVRHPLYPLKTYGEFTVDPLAVLLNGLSKLNRDGQGAAIQLVVGARRASFAHGCAGAVERIKRGTRVEEALRGVGDSFLGALLRHAVTLFTKTRENEEENEEKRARAVDQTLLDQFAKKLKTPFVSVNLRLVASAADEAGARAIANDIASSFNQFESGHGNRIAWRIFPARRADERLHRFSLRSFTRDEEMIVNIEEAATLMHFPVASLRAATPQLKQASAGEAPIPLDAPAEGVRLGVNVFRGRETPVFISPEDRMRHLYIIGQTGTGKTTLIKNMLAQDIAEGRGVCFIDPHGSDVLDVLSLVPQHRADDVVYFDPASLDRPLGLNMLEFDPRFPEQKTFVVNEMFGIFQKLYGAVPESMGPMFEQYFRNATMLVIEDPGSGSTLLDVSRVMSNKAFRERKLAACQNPVVVQFWREVAERAGGEAALTNIVPYITSKFDVFLANDIMRPIVAQQTSSFSVRDLMDNRKILLVNLSKGRLGDINSHLLGLILVGKVLMAALSRADAAARDMPDFFLYLDEFQNITTDSIAIILSEARKYRLSLTLAHQFIGQLDDEVRSAVFGNVGSLAVYRVGPEDAEFLEKQLAPTFTARDIVNLPNYRAYLRLLAHGKPEPPFSIAHDPPAVGDRSRADALREKSALTYGRPRTKVEQEIMARYAG